MKYLFCLISFLSYSGDYSTEVKFSLGYAVVNFTENENRGDENLDPEFDDSAQSGSVGQASLDFSYTLFSKRRYSLSLMGTVPFFTDGNQGFFHLGIGWKYFLLSHSGRLKMVLPGDSQLSLTPDWRFYIGAEIGPSYLLYQTPVADKGDLLFDINLTGGIAYQIGKEWGLNFDVLAGRGIGLATTTLKFQGSFGINYYF